MADFHQFSYIPAIKKLKLHLPCVHILGTCHCDNTRRDAFNHCEYYQDVFFYIEYSERVVTSFVRQVKY